MGEDKRGGPVRGTVSIVLSEDLERGREGGREGGREYTTCKGLTIF